MAHDVFISHSSKDKHTADAICARLEAHDIRCWITPRDIQPGADWSEAIVRAIAGSRITVLVFSSHSNASLQVRREIQRSFEKSVIVIPFRVEEVFPCEALEYYLASVHWLDALTPDKERHLQELEETIRALLAGSRTAGEQTGVAPTHAGAEALSEAPPRRSAGNLPQPLTRFIGREQEIEQVRALLAAAHLVTLTGMGGTGKTRMALTVGERDREAYREGVWLIELAPLSDASLVAQAVASALSVEEEPGRTLATTLTVFLADRSLLLLLDNCEHLLDGCAQLARDLLTRCPDLRILATSREPLGIPGETAWPVPPLPVPTDADLLSAEHLNTFPAIQLFAERAVTVLPSFLLTEENGPVVGRICQRLDGLPLAIELAAARLRALSPSQILQRLDDRFRLLTGGSRTALPRQQTLRTLIDWSHDLLLEVEQTLFRRIAVFAGGWTLDAAEAVCSGGTIEDWEVLDVLAALVDKSLVVAEHGRDTTRYGLLETIRHYAEEKLVQAGEAGALRARHGAFFLELAENAERHLSGAEQASWINRLDGERENLRAALAFFQADGQSAEKALRLGGALARFWSLLGYLQEGRAALTAALSYPHSRELPALRAKVLNGAGSLAWSQGDYAAAKTFFDECLDLRHDLKDEQGAADVLNNLGNVAWVQGNLPQARTCFEEALQRLRALGDAAGVAATLSNLGTVISEQGEDEPAHALLEESLALDRERSDQAGMAYTLDTLGDIAFRQGNCERALAYKRESLARRRDVGDKQGTAESLEGIACILAATGASEKAAHLLGAAESLRDSIGVPLAPNIRERHDRSVEATRAAVGEEAYRALCTQGRAIDLEEVWVMAFQPLPGSG